VKSEFDPYRKWLGIPPTEQPPNHYRLLAIPLFEPDADVISHARDARMAHIKTFQSGPHSQWSQRILNELAAASVCLLSPEKKQKYDQELRTRLRAAAPSVRPVRAGRAAPSRPRGLPVVLAGVSVLVLMGGLWMMWGRQDGRRDSGTEPNRAEQPGPVSAARPAAPPAKPSPEPPQPASERSESSEDTRPAPEVAPPAKPEPPVPAEPSPPAETAPPTTMASQAAAEPSMPAEPKTAAPAEEPSPAPADKRLPVPREEQQKTIEKEIRQVFREDFAAAGSEERVALAKKLQEQAGKTTDDPAVKYVLLRLSAELAATAGQIAISLETVDEMAATFQVNAIAMKADMVGRCVELVQAGKKTPFDLQSVVPTVRSLADAAIAADDYATAKRLNKYLLPMARMMKDLGLQRELAAQERELETLVRSDAEVQKARKTLAETPDSPEANTTLGQWNCFRKGAWEEGLPYLAKGSDAPLAALARRDLTNPDSPQAQEELGDAWWNLYEKEKGATRTAFQGRAVDWYERALPEASRLSKVKIQKRLQAAGEPAKGRGKAAGVVQRGNVALAANGTVVFGNIIAPGNLLDGNSTRYDVTNGHSCAKIPSEWTIVFNKVYRLQQIRFLLYDRDPRFFRYTVSVSAEGRSFAPVADRSQGEWRGWQVIEFQPRAVKAVRLNGLYTSDTAHPFFFVVEFEAYCFPPDSRKP